MRTKSIELTAIRSNGNLSDHEGPGLDRPYDFPIIVPKGFNSLSYVSPKHTELGDRLGENTDDLQHGELRTTPASMIVSKLVFSREIKSKSNNSKTNRSSNLKLGQTPPITGIKKFLQGSLRPSPIHKISIGKSFDEVPSTRQPVFCGITESKTLQTEPKGSFKKVAKELVYLKNQRNMNQGYNNHLFVNEDKTELN